MASHDDRLSPTRARFVFAGAALSLAVPIGLVVVRVLDGGGAVSPGADVWASRATYGWVALSSMAVTTGLAWVLGRRNDDARRLSVTDPLTGLFNRRHFSTRLETAMVRDRRDGAPTCVMCVDVDRLKVINDQLGHGRGDEALVHVASVLTRRLRFRDLVARLGGDEFLVAADRALYWVKNSGGGRVALAPRAVIEGGQVQGGAA
jgi:GGDEF domain-containing protein